MSVIVKGLEMPKDGCHHMICIYADGTVSTGGRVYMAFPIPPHGDLIDRNTLKNVQQADADLFKDSSDYGEKCRYDEAINAVANIINAPTIIPAEEE